MKEAENALHKQASKSNGFVLTLPALSSKTSFLAFKMLAKIANFQLQKKSFFLHFYPLLAFCIIFHVFIPCKSLY